MLTWQRTVAVGLMVAGAVAIAIVGNPDAMPLAYTLSGAAASALMPPMGGKANGNGS